MLDMTRGPSTKPAWAATSSRAPSEKIVTTGEAVDPAASRRKEGVGQDGVEGLALHRLDPHQQVAQEQDAGREGQGGGHVEHGALAGLHPRLAHDLQAVGDRLDPGVGAAAQGVGPQEEEQDAEGADGGEVVPEVRRRAAATTGTIRSAWVEMPYSSMTRWVSTKSMKMGARTVMDSLTPRTLRMIRTMVRMQATGDLVMVQGLGEVAEQGVAAGGDRDGDGHDVIHQQGAAGYDPRLLAEDVGGDDVAAASVGKVLDDAGVGVGDDENGQRGGQCQRPGPGSGARPGRGRPLPGRRPRTTGRRPPGRPRPAPVSGPSCGTAAGPSGVSGRRSWRAAICR